MMMKSMFYSLFRKCIYLFESVFYVNDRDSGPGLEKNSSKGHLRLFHEAKIQCRDVRKYNMGMSH